jgi:hypothetical protein
LETARLGDLVSACLLALLIAFTASAPAVAEEAIESFRADIVVERDGTVEVKETIFVQAEGQNIRRGIFRDIATTFEDAEGNIHRNGFEVTGVTRDAEPEPYHIEHHSDYARVVIGSEDVLLSPGDYTYTLTYEIDRQVRWFDGRPEIFWNVTGNEWAFPIERAAATLTLPENAVPVQWDAYTGRGGERGTAFRGSVTDGVLSVATTRPLEPGEGLSIVAELPADVVEQPDATARARHFLRDNIGWIIGLLGLVAVLVYYLWAWNRVGRDPESGTIIPLFHPPEGVSPALAFYIDNWGISNKAWRALTAAALSLAVRGLLVFNQSGKDLVLERTDQSADDVRASLPEGERKLLHWVEGKGGRAEISRANGKSVAQIANDFRKGVAAESGGRHFRLNIAFLTVGILASAAVIGAIFFFAHLSEGERVLLIGLVVAGSIFAFLFAPTATQLLQRPSLKSIGMLLVTLIMVAGGTAYVLFSMLAEIPGGAGAVFALLRANTLPLVVAIAFPLLSGIFYYLLRAPTPAGRPVMDHLDGFRMYLETAESGRLNIENEPEITTERFEALLPYAVALNVEKPWANAFSAALARAHPGESDPMRHYQPRWRRGGSWSGSNLGSSIAASVAGATSALASSMPRSSSGSSGFGGGSGGGGGGRGGGGW